MIGVEEALKIIKENLLKFSTEEIPLADSIGKIAAEDIYADRDFPPYDRVTMDGIAIHFASYQNGQRQFPIESIGAAGSPQLTLQNPAACIEIMTGAVLPNGCDTVIRYEDLKMEEGIAGIQIETVTQGQNVHNKGEDRKADSLIIPNKSKISPAEIGVLATVGKSTVKVKAIPKTIIISTGDELVEIEEKPLPHQIRKSNVHRLQASLKELGFEADRLHLDDDKVEIHNKMKSVLENYPIVMLSGGVSKGKFDYIPSVLEELGVEKLFHRIAQRPGKPFWFGKARNGALIFAFPGNPVSSFLNMQYYFKSWLFASLGWERKLAYAELAADVFFKPDLTYFLQVKISSDPTAKQLAIPVEGHGSGDLANLMDADAFLILPRGKNDFKKGEVYPYFLFR